MPEIFGTMPDGQPVHRFELANETLRVRILEIGAAVQSIEAPDRWGKRANVVLGMATLEDYRLRSPHFGAVPGRYAGRIANGRITIDGETFELVRNAGQNTLHGGTDGFGRRAWSTINHSPTEVGLRLVSRDGDAGFPGEVQVDLRYSLRGGALQMDYTVVTTRPTVVNLTNHSYFNLAGEGSGSVLDHDLQLEADQVLELDEGGMPTGRLVPVAATPFDFRTPVRLGKRIREADRQLTVVKGYDHALLVRGSGLRRAAVLHEPQSGRSLTVMTTEPSIQLYTANNLFGDLGGTSGRTYRQSDAVCLEAQRPAYSTEHPALPQPVLRPGETFRATTIFQFDPGLPGAE